MQVARVPVAAHPAAPAQDPTLASGVFACEPVGSSADSGLLTAPLPQAAHSSQQPWPAASQQGAVPGLKQGFTPPQPRAHAPQQARLQPHAAASHCVPSVASSNPANASQAIHRAGTPLSAARQVPLLPVPHARAAAACEALHAAAHAQAGYPQGGPPAAGLEPGGEGAKLCAHGVPLAACSHALEHLRDIKSFLLDVCEELLDGQPGLRAVRVHVLHHEYLKLMYSALHT